MSLHGNWLCFTSSTGALGGSFLSGTVRAKPRLYYDQFNRSLPYIAAPNQLLTGWYRPFSEPVRSRPQHYWRDHFNRNASFFNGITQRLGDWYKPLTEPVRRKPPLPQGAIPYLFGNIPNVSYSFALTETGDSITMTIGAHPPQNRARVVITEMGTATAQVTIREINYNKGYS